MTAAPALRPLERCWRAAPVSSGDKDAAEASGARASAVLHPTCEFRGSPHGSLFLLGSVRMNRQLTAIVERQGSSYVALCPEVDVASQGQTVSEARDNLAEALALFFETASADEITARLRDEVYVTQIEVMVG